MAIAGLAFSVALPASAHGTGRSLAAPGWTWDPWVTAPMLLSVVWFFAGYLRLRRRSARSGVYLRSALWFTAGWLVLAAALVTPLHQAGERSFAAHMLEHELLMLVAAPLLVLSRPVGIGLWAVPRAVRQALAQAGRNGVFQQAWRTLTAPVAATALQAVALWLWHAPRLFDLALADDGWHVLQHLSFLVTALLFWWAMLRGSERRVGIVVGCLFFTAVISGALGALMAFSSSPWYVGYAAAGLDAFGLSPAEDQQLAGVLMWVPGGLVHAAAGVWLLSRGLVERPDGGVARSLPTLVLVLAVGTMAYVPRSDAETLYVSDEQADVIHVVEAPHWNAIARIEVGRRPRGLALSRDGKQLYVAVSNDNRIDVVDLAEGKVIGHLPSGADPERFARSPDGRWLYVANEDDAKVSFVDIDARKIVAEVAVGAEPEGMAVSPDGRWVVCTSESASLVHFIDARTHALVDSVMVGTRPRDAVFSADGRWLWVSSETRATVAVFDMRTRRVVRTIDFDRDEDAPETVQAVGIALDPKHGRGFIALGRGNQVAEVDIADGSILRYFPVGSRNWGVALSPDGKRLYAANGLSGDVSVIDLTNNRPLATIRTGGKPWNVVVRP